MSHIARFFRYWPDEDWQFAGINQFFDTDHFFEENPHGEIVAVDLDRVSGVVTTRSSDGQLRTVNPAQRAD